MVEEVLRWQDIVFPQGMVSVTKTIMSRNGDVIVNLSSTRIWPLTLSPWATVSLAASASLPSYWEPSDPRQKTVSSRLARATPLTNFTAGTGLFAPKGNDWKIFWSMFIFWQNLPSLEMISFQIIYDINKLLKYETFMVNWVNYKTYCVTVIYHKVGLPPVLCTGTAVAFTVCRRVTDRA